MPTVDEVLTIATDSVTVINGINDGSIVRSDLTQDEINEMVQNNVAHLELVLTYNGSNNKPDIAGSSADKSSYTTAITTGKAYIAANS